MRMRSPSRVLGASIAKVPALATVNPEEAARLGNDQDTPKLTALLKQFFTTHVITF